MPDTPDPSLDPNSATIPLSGPRPTLSGSNVDLPLPEELTKLLPAGAYEITGFLGAGGMGAVYKGMQVRLKRPVAIKIMRRDMGRDHDFEARFEREAQAMAKLNHPNIVSVIDYGEAGPDYLYIVMELVDGTDLMDVIRSKQMTQEMALTLLPQICDALQFAHDHGIVHRDIKPSNIMLTRDGRVKMADFGLAKPFDVAESSFRTQTGTGMGTPDYAAPEQFDPTTPVDHRADIYALGVMIYQMITGALPRGVWRPPSQRASVSTHWDAIVSRAMQNDPAERYQKASEVKTDVSSIPLAGKEGSADTPARPSSKGDAAAKQNEAHKSMRAPAKFRAPLLIVAAAAVLGIAAFVVFGKKQPPPRQDASASLPPTSPGQPNLTNTGRTKSSQATTNAASHEGLLTIRSITPSSPARLKAGEKVKLQIDFHNPGERVIHIWAHPLKHGVMSNLATTSGSFPTNERNGTVERWFSYKEAGDAEEVRVEMVTESETPSRAIIGKVVIPINVTWTGASKPATDTVPLPAATKPPPFVNTLGMKFVPVPGMKVLFSIWDTRVMDYEKYVVAKPDVDGSWKTQQYHGVPVGREPDHPVVAVSWEDAQAFCQWLTEKETAAGTLPPGAKYRLPTDAEWSTAAGLPPERGSTPWERDSQNTEDFPWGKEWPPTQKAGNYADETFHANLPPVKNEKTGRIDNLEWFKDYDDGFAATSPVGRFPANMFGLYDMGGNVWQWCEDWNPPHNGHVLRGGSWMIGVRSYMHSSRRIYSVPHRDGNYGFRCVLELAPAGSTASAISPSPNLPVSASSTKFPPGQWVGLFTKYEELPETLGKAQLKIEERWIRCSLSETGTGLLLPAFTSGAVRARFRVGSAADPTQTKSRIYLRETVTGQSYSQGIIPGKLMCQRREGDRFTKVFETPLPQPVGDGYQIEFGVVGSRLVGRANNQVFSTAPDTTFQGRKNVIQSYEDVTDIEVINLDGLSETEALKILGVDEKGNDLRGKVAAYAPLSPLPPSLEARAIRLWDSAAKVKGDALGVKWEKESLRLDHRGLGAPGLAVRDLILRASILANPDAEKTKLQLRNPPGISAGDTAYGIVVDASSRAVQMGMHKKDQKGSSLGSWKLPRAYGPDEWIKLEFRAIGDVLTVGADGLVLGTVRDGTLDQPGGFELYAESKGYFRDISYIPLDGLSEAETLKILGVDEKGNDLRGKNATASAAVPPGQWVKLFTKAEDLPAELRNPARGVKWEDGWIRWEVGKPHRFYVVDALSNYAIRATMLRQGKEYRPEWLMMRVDSPPSVAGYVFGVSTQNCLFAGRRTDESLSPEIMWKECEPAIRLPRIGEEYTLELGCVGDKFIGRLGKEFVKVITDTKWGRGRGCLTGREPIRDIEVMNLDGLPEAEALRLLGVDEQGNDVRGKTGTAK